MCVRRQQSPQSIFFFYIYTYSLRRPHTELVCKRFDRSSCSHQTDPPAADPFVDQAESRPQRPPTEIRE